jgi:predicted ribosome quality control (RQC) complex YloA/Tae2 family protein
MAVSSEEYLKRLAPQFARLGIWNGKFAPVQERLLGASIQKITASDEGFVCLSVYKPGDDRSAVVLSIRKSDPGIFLSHTRPKPQLQPNSFVQIARKYIIGRRIRYAYCSVDPVCFFIECEPPHQSQDTGELPDTIVLDLESKPARVLIAKKHVGVPSRYSQVNEGQKWAGNDEFYESLCEWSLELTKTKRRASFELPLLSYCCYFDKTKQPAPTIPRAQSQQHGHPVQNVPHLNASEGARAAEGGQSQHDQHEFGFAEKRAFEQQEMNFAKAMSLLPVHIRKAVKVRLQFLERRLLRQRGDLPLESELARHARRAEGMRAHQYLWPEKSNTWYVPQEVIEEYGLPTFFQLKSGQKPSDLMEEEFRQLGRLKRRRSELLRRMDESKQAIDDFHSKVTETGRAIAAEIEKLAPHGQYSLSDLGVYFSRIEPAGAATLCRDLEVSWTQAPTRSGSNHQASQGAAPKLPYRAYRASTGEFIHVARSAADGDLMIKLMPSHHTWLHVLTGEGSHVWLQKPGKSEPSAAAVREAAILAVHNSRLSRGRQGEVRVATRADIEKKKNLAPGKVLVRRCKTILVKYEAPELEVILKPSTTTPEPQLHQGRPT